MCGIFGYANYGVGQPIQAILDTLFDGLQRLEYRGYDSAGVCVDAPAGEPGARCPLVIKHQGKISDLRVRAAEVLEENTLFAGELYSTHVGIGHTRWATHGPPNATNSHPHVNGPDGEFVVVHNGIITNHATLKPFLAKNGAVFVSDTDTEVVPHLCEYLWKKRGGKVSLGQLAMEVCSRLEGAYALLIRSARYPNELVACKQGSPLVYGLKRRDPAAANGATNGDATGRDQGGAVSSASRLSASLLGAGGAGTEFWLASDSAALLTHTRDVVVLEDGDLLHVDAYGRPHVFNSLAMTSRTLAKADMADLEVKREGRKIEAEVESIMKGGYDHYMQKEIHEQPKTLADTMRGRVVLDGKPFKPVKSSAPDVIFSGHFIDPCESASLFSGSNIAAASGAEGGFELPSRIGGKKARAKEPTPAGALFSGALLGAAAAATAAPDKAAAPASAGFMEEGIPAAGESEPFIKLGGLSDHVEGILRCRRIVFIACGTSYHACLVARKTLEEFAAMPVVVELAGDFMDREAPVFRDDTCVFVSQSGETADTLRALEYAKAKGALCVGITNTVGSAISNATHCGVHLNAGFEIGVASTKAYTSQIVALTMMALLLGADSRAKMPKRIAAMRALARLPDDAREVLELDASMHKLAEQLKDAQSLIFFGRGYNFSTALEAALKVKEVALIHSEGINAGEMKHGPLALVDENLPIVVIATQDAMHRKMESVIQQLLARSAKLVILCNTGDDAMTQFEGRGCTLIRVPRTVDALQPIINIIPLQLLSYHLTTLRGFNVDQPRNLAKSVTVTED
ncbi:glucosamine--fructose-6-phosphateaminotransferase (isomerizing) [Monoraphidium neglectum]|uniref:glutamine--fructose-6-phosphate transaminase (isomerizing) n=1 Tax=Monoraphidium neglectum TaxID=145388 RepID=A0A0D2N1B3_9CHLO|nr:glucosamine--fructose-6-phosphateaminotransferase (isomerizing) [Monoraphidium neglectum]KIZ06322.1 glucosamine--fructose-6-phosphateaminotransferase (isomerizing) [Monoraphidium neglectum]|eukprot:XP_013905341.1 glucosamine--fructose-6-phosphateaminotransferase (isomerizing) [Monoraphidium neglectum]